MQCSAALDCGHDGSFKSVEAITHFYNPRYEEMPPPEVLECRDPEELSVVH